MKILAKTGIAFSLISILIIIFFIVIYLNNLVLIPEQIKVITYELLPIIQHVILFVVLLKLYPNKFTLSLILISILLSISNRFIVEKFMNRHLSVIQFDIYITLTFIITLSLYVSNLFCKNIFQKPIKIYGVAHILNYITFIILNLLIARYLDRNEYEKYKSLYIKGISGFIIDLFFYYQVLRILNKPKELINVKY